MIDISERPLKLSITIISSSHTRDDQLGICGSIYRSNLDVEGKNRTKLAGNEIKNSKYDIVVCSDDSSCVQTMEGVKESYLKHGKYKWPSLTVSSRLLHPLKHGVCEGMSKEILFESILKSDAPVNEFKPKGGDSIETLSKRVKEFMLRVSCAYLLGMVDGGLKPTENHISRVLIFTHESWVIELMETIENKGKKIIIREEDEKGPKLLPPHYLSNNLCSISKLEVTCPNIQECVEQGRQFVTEDKFLYEVKSNRSTSHLLPKEASYREI